ncbi:MAG: right-handed parallel beta-helix repeat-containing protein [Prolixibacteraceae bacterium]|nr:right-handed parallel beta-helix repeat-containing protein [Prolixibacteraceae bacterium]
MNYCWSVAPRLLLFLLCLFLNRTPITAQGRLLRGEVWQDYTLVNKKADFFVSTKGNDSWSGRLAEPNLAGTDGPFATVQRAQKAVRALKTTIFHPKKPALDKRFIGSPHPYGTGKDILVSIRDGVYSLDSTLHFNALDGGERIETELPTGAFEYHQLKDYFVTYASYPGEHAVLSGGERITGWKKSSGAKWQVQLKTQKVKELFANGRRQMLARTPNQGYFYTDGQPTDPGSFSFRPGDLKAWKDISSNRITMTVRWGAVHTSLTKIDEKKRRAYLKDPDEGLLNVPPKYYVENLEALLDTAGEWFFDQKTKVLTYIPDKGIDNPNNALVLSPRTAGLIHAEGTREKPLRNLRLFNLTFSTTAPGDRSTLDFSYAKNCEVIGNTIENVSQSAIYFGLGSYHNLIDQNIIQNITGSGIAVYGSPIPEQWGDLVSDNGITRNEVANLRPAMVGIRTANAMRTTVTNNYITNTGSYGITVGSWPNVEETSDGSHLVEYNHLSFTNMARDDEGAIAVYGLSPGSVVRENLIHDVKPATTNENVGLFLQNMASGWSLTNNILYGLKQAEMKLCAAYLENNVYRDNHMIERPQIEPEKIINGLPNYKYSELQLLSPEGSKTGATLVFKAVVTNNGSTGNGIVPLYVDGKIAESQLFPVVAKNSRTVEFRHQFFTPGKHTVSIGTTPDQSIDIKGDPIQVLYSNLATEADVLPLGDSARIFVTVKNVMSEQIDQELFLSVNQKIVASNVISLQAEESKTVRFSFLPEAGNQSVTIGNQSPLPLHVFPIRKVDFTQAQLQTFCSTTAKPCEYDYNVGENSYRIIARGTDFLHAEDSYGAIFLPKSVSGNFVATVKVVELGKAVSDWFRFGIFVRNNLAKTGNEKGSPGSFLMFSTPKRHGAQWDEFGDGAMHNSRSFNYSSDHPFPLWLKMVRHGDRISGYYSFDGKNWILSRESGNIAGIAHTLDIGLAAGSNDQKSSMVRFEDFQVWAEQ